MHVPLFSKKGQWQFDLTSTESSETAAGYAISDHLALVAAGRFPDKITNDSNFHRNEALDIGGGYYYAGDFSKYLPLRLEIYGLLGTGYTDVVNVTPCFHFYGWAPHFPQNATISIEEVDECSSGFFKYSYMKYALQLNVGLDWKFFAIAGSVRAGYMDLYNVSRIVRTEDSTLTDTGPAGSTFIDVALTLRIMPFEHVGIEGQATTGTMNKTMGFRDSQKRDVSSLGLFVIF